MNTSLRSAGTERAAGTASAFIEISGAAKHFDGGATALAHVDLTIERGEAVAILGPSGCGKSTLINLIAGLDRPTAGSVTVDGTRVDTLSEARSAIYRRSTVGMVFQFFNLLDDLTAMDNVLLPAQLAGTDRAAARARAAALLADLGIADQADAYPGRLSGGEQQRVALSRALVNYPPLLLADEPTGALDTASGRRVAGLLKGIHAAGHTVILVTHDRTLAHEIAGRIIELVDGRVAYDSAAAAR
jgi:putative ABC transport system ATP-binding protein